LIFAIRFNIAFQFNKNLSDLISKQPIKADFKDCLYCRCRDKPVEGIEPTTPRLRGERSAIDYKQVEFNESLSGF
jgi:hypothetical protein